MWSRRSAIERCRSFATYVVSRARFCKPRAHGGREAWIFFNLFYWPKSLNNHFELAYVVSGTRFRLLRARGKREFYHGSIFFYQDGLLILLVQVSKQSFWGGLCSEKSMFSRAAGVRLVVSKNFTSKTHLKIQFCLLGAIFASKFATKTYFVQILCNVQFPQNPPCCNLFNACRCPYSSII